LTPDFLKPNLTNLILFVFVLSFWNAAMDDEPFYEVVAFEISDRCIRPGLWAKALAESGGNETLARARYIELRAQQLKDEANSAAAQTRADQLRSTLGVVHNVAMTTFGRVVFLFASGAFALFGIGNVVSAVNLIFGSPASDRVGALILLLFGALMLGFAYALLKKANGSYSA